MNGSKVICDIGSKPSEFLHGFKHYFLVSKRKKKCWILLKCLKSQFTKILIYHPVISILTTIPNMIYFVFTLGFFKFKAQCRHIRQLITLRDLCWVECFPSECIPNMSLEDPLSRSVLAYNLMSYLGILSNFKYTFSPIKLTTLFSESKEKWFYWSFSIKNHSSPFGCYWVVATFYTYVKDV